MLNVGLTGGIACGKSTVARMLTEAGAYLIDADALVREVETPPGPVWQAIVAHFGEAILAPDGQIDRRRLGAIVFGDAAQRDALNRLVHPAIHAERRRRIAAIAADRPEAIILSDVPLLFETGLQAEFDLVLLVYLPAPAQLERLMARDSLGREEAEARLASQMPIDVKLSLADLVIRNDGTPEETRSLVAEAWGELQRREQARRQG